VIVRLALCVLFVAVCGCAACPVVAPEAAPVPKVDAGPPVLADGPVTFRTAGNEIFAELANGELRIADGYTCADVALAAVQTVNRMNQVATEAAQRAKQ